MIVAMDGPAGAGKSTIATAVARALGFQLIDTGAMYRTVAHRALEAGVALDDADASSQIANALDFHFAFEGDKNIAYCNGERLGPEIRTQAVSQASSLVSAHPEVRQALIALQRRIGSARDSVLEGRDIGTVVFPQAEVKVFLTASAAERARRRVAQLTDAGEEAEYDTILSEIEDRDRRDTDRAHSPLIQAEDAVVIDSTGLTPDEIIARIVAMAS